MENEKKPEGEQVTLTKEEYDKLVLDNANLTQTKTNLVNEITELREKKNLSESEKEELAKKVEELKSKATPEVKEDLSEAATKIVSQLLSDKEKKDRETLLSEATSEFKESNPEFKEANDPGGLKWNAFEKKLGQYNLDIFKTKTQLNQLFSEVNSILNPQKPAPEEEEIVDLPPTDFKDPKAVEKVVLDNLEQKLVNGSYYNGNKAKYLKDKVKRPDFIRQLMSYVR